MNQRPRSLTGKESCRTAFPAAFQEKIYFVQSAMLPGFLLPFVNSVQFLQCLLRGYVLSKHCSFVDISTISLVFCRFVDVSLARLLCSPASVPAWAMLGPPVVLGRNWRTHHRIGTAWLGVLWVADVFPFGISGSIDSLFLA